MSLKFRRNYPIILLLIAFIALLTFTMGDQYLVSYSISLDNQATALAANSWFDNTDSEAAFSNVSIDSMDSETALADTPIDSIQSMVTQ